MKKLLLLLMLVPLFTSSSNAQQTYRDRATPITWLGIDCSHMKFKLTDETISNNDLQNKYFAAWNDLFINEKDKYNIPKATKHGDVNYNIDPVNQINENADGPFIVSNNADIKRFSTQDIASFVKKYKLSGNGVGLVFIVESMDKGSKEAVVWTVYMDMATKEVLKAERTTEEPGGFGFRNYWAGAFNKILKHFPM